MPSKRKNNQPLKKINLLRIGFILLILSMIFLYLKYRSVAPAQVKTDTAQVEDSNQTGLQSKNERLAWETYVNTEYGIFFDVPKLLMKRDSLGVEDYLFFMRFEENKFSKEKGVAFGIRESDLDTELNKTKAELKDQGDLQKETDLVIEEMQAKRLDYRPKDEGAEERSIVFIERFGKVYSLSSVPAQMDRLIESVKFF